jgi:hypothetical protein
MNAGTRRLETKEKSMATKSSELSAMRALLVGAALTGLIAGTTSAQASVAGDGVGQVTTPTAKSALHCRRHCRHYCRYCRHYCRAAAA